MAIPCHCPETTTQGTTALLRFQLLKLEEPPPLRMCREDSSPDTQTKALETQGTQASGTGSGPGCLGGGSWAGGLPHRGRHSG